MSVLDVGCGTGAISAGIAAVVGERGHVEAIDRDDALLSIARDAYKHLPNIAFVRLNACEMKYSERFDVVTASRVLQWLDKPLDALLLMKAAARKGGKIVILDYNHVNNQWSPEPPSAFRAFYDAFLSWRRANRWDNLMADHLPALFRSAGLDEIKVFGTCEIAARGDSCFAQSSEIWLSVIKTVGPAIVAAGHLTESERIMAEAKYDEWIRSTLARQTLELRTVVGTVVR